jgi:hypothetical protein
MGEAEAGKAGGPGSDALMSMELTEPSEIVDGLGVEDLKELLEDMKPFLEMAKADGRAGKGRQGVDYWNALTVSEAVIDDD